MNPLGCTARGFCPLGRIDPQYPLLIEELEGVKKGQRSENLNFAAVLKELLRAGRTLNYHNKENNIRS